MFRCACAYLDVCVIISGEQNISEIYDRILVVFGGVQTDRLDFVGDGRIERKSFRLVLILSARRCGDLVYRCKRR